MTTTMPTPPLHTPAHFMFFGFNAAIATQMSISLADRYAVGDPTASVEDTIHAYFEYTYHDAPASSTDAQWLHALTMLGVAPELREAFIEPQHYEIRNTRTAKYWIMETIADRQANLSQNSLEAKGPEVTTLAKDPELIEGHLQLWKGCSYARTANVLNSDGQVVKLTALVSRPPSDFSGGDSLYYFLQSRALAEKYASWTLRRSGSGAVPYTWCRCSSLTPS